MSTLSAKVTAFRELHVPGAPFVLANAWDLGSAKVLAALGARALATSSAAFAFTLGRPDGGTVSRDEALAHAETLAAHTNLPVSGDFENGFGDAASDCADTVRLSIDAGLAGLSIEDISFPDGAPYPFGAAVERIGAAADAAGDRIVLCARADGMMTGHYGLDEAIRRLRAFSKAGAEVLYAPLPPRREDIATICQAVDRPVNVLVAGQFATMTTADLASAGAARISFGSALARVTHRALLDAASAALKGGDFSPFLNGASGDSIDMLLRAHAEVTA
ncbi:MAG: isocitrate lyase/phosphoenolpyruvate mutase family protein [Pseudomonadota bacterium]